MTKVVIRADDVAGFFARAKDAAQRADRGVAFERKMTLTFEDPKRMFTVLSEARRRLMLEVMQESQRPSTSFRSNSIAIARPSPRTWGFSKAWACWSPSDRPTRVTASRRSCARALPRLKEWQRVTGRIVFRNRYGEDEGVFTRRLAHGRSHPDYGGFPAG